MSPWLSPLALSLCLGLASPSLASPISASTTKPDGDPASVLLSSEQSGTGHAEVTHSTLEGLRESEEVALQPPPSAGERRPAAFWRSGRSSQ
ncbi:MAG: hypothetical protein QNK05_19700 [Myxococcota bacterium]|nr:hypothetical protein [Myxococcota bacterium]